MAEGWIARGEALARLGVKTQTLYAYVSRGRIAARPDPEHPRRSLYAAHDVARLRGEAPAAPAVVIEMPAGRGEAQLVTAISAQVGGRRLYRGRDVVALAREASFEDAARLLLGAGAQNPFAGLSPRVDGFVGGAVRARLFAALARRASEDAPATGRDAQTLRAEACAVLSEAVDAVAGPGPRLFLHQRLARAWKASERDAPLLRRALVLGADAGLDGAVLTARAAAGSGAGPAAAALAGLSALAASPSALALAQASEFVTEARRDPAAAIARWAPELPNLSAEADACADSLVQALDLPPDLKAVLSSSHAATGGHAGFGFALAMTARRLDLPREGAVDLMLIARLAGLLAHAVEQAVDGSPVRARLRYVGPSPDGF